VIGWYTLPFTSAGLIAAVAALVWVLVKRRQPSPPPPQNPFVAFSAPHPPPSLRSVGDLPHKGGGGGLSVSPPAA